MRDYGRVYTKFWVSPDIMSLSDDAKLLALYLLTGQHSNALGCFRLPSGYVAADLGFNPLERVSKGFDELFSIGFVTLGKGDWILLPKYLKFNAPENPNVGKMVHKLYQQIPESSGLMHQASQAICAFPKNMPQELITLCKGYSKPFPKGMANQHETPEPEPEPEPEPLKKNNITTEKSEEKKPDHNHTKSFWKRFPKDKTPQEELAEAEKQMESLNRMMSNDKEKAILMDSVGMNGINAMRTRYQTAIDAAKNRMNTNV